MKSLLPFLSLCLLISCGDNGLSNSSSKNEVSQNEVAVDDGSNVSGIYSASLWPVNHNLHFKEVGSVALVRADDNFQAMVKLNYGSANTYHRQAIYTGRRCPNLNDDLNKDAYIDANEAKLALGMITIPLDDDLDSQSSGSGFRATSDSAGKYSYKRSASFDRMFSDLKALDENPGDSTTKLPAGEGITFPGRVLIIHGVAESIALPPTVTDANGESAHQSLPVACAVLWKTLEVPSELQGL